MVNELNVSSLIPIHVTQHGIRKGAEGVNLPRLAFLQYAYTLKRNTTTSPSCMT